MPALKRRVTSRDAAERAGVRRNGDFLISNFGTDCLELMSRDGTSHVLADDRRRADRQGQLRAPRFARSYLDHGVHQDQKLDAGAAERSGGRLPGAIRTADSASWPTASASPTRFASMRTKVPVRRRDGGCITRLRIDEAGDPKRRKFRSRRIGRGAWPDGIAFDSSGNLWGTLVYSDKLFVLTPEGDMRVLLDEGDRQRWACSGRRSSKDGDHEDVYLRPAGAWRPGWLVSRSEDRICKRRTSARSALAFRIPRPRAGAADGRLEREALGPHVGRSQG